MALIEAYRGLDRVKVRMEFRQIYLFFRLRTFFFIVIFSFLNPTPTKQQLYFLPLLVQLSLLVQPTCT